MRDNAYGVPHIYGDTRADTMFGAGYAGAADRLFLMDVLRHTGRAELASFLGGANAEAWTPPVGLRALHRSRPGKADRRRRRRLYGAAGQQAVDDVNDYVDGINAYIAAANLNPQAEAGRVRAALGKPMEPWKATDVIAIASLVGGIFGKGGGNELNSALTMQAFVERMGKKAGRKAWLGFRSKNDPEAPTTIAKRFPYETRSAFAKRGPGAARPELGALHAGRADRLGGAARGGTASPASATGSARRSKPPGTPPTGSWSRPSTRPPATRSR